MNELVDANRVSRYAGAAMKRAADERVMFAAMEYRVPVFTGPVTITCHYFAKDRRKDKSNVRAAIKFIEDALVTMGRIPGDGWNLCTPGPDRFDVDSSFPRIEVVVEAAS